jgi:hypothetical protein
VPLGVRRLTKNNAAYYEWLSLGLALFDGLLFMPAVGYAELMYDSVGILLPLCYLAVPLVTATLFYLRSSRSSRAKYTLHFRTGMLVFLELSIFFILFNADDYLTGYRFTNFTTLLVCMTIHMAVTHFGFDRTLSAVYGAEFDGTRGDKADLLRYALEMEGLPTEGFMIGDRSYDIRGALEVGLTPIGVLWGYGDRRELTEAGCPEENLASTPQDVVKIILRSAK